MDWSTAQLCQLVRDLRCFLYPPIAQDCSICQQCRCIIGQSAGTARILSLADTQPTCLLPLTLRSAIDSLWYDYSLIAVSICMYTLHSLYLGGSRNCPPFLFTRSAKDIGEYRGNTIPCVTKRSEVQITFIAWVPNIWLPNIWDSS